jgi:hypothetical protein
LPANRHANLQANLLAILPPQIKRSTEQANLTKQGQQAKLKKTKTPSKVEQS